MNVGSSSYPHTPKGWPKGEVGEPVVSEPCPNICASLRCCSTKAGDAPANPTWLWLKGSGFLDKGI